MAELDLSNYIEVHERIAAFKDAHKEGSLQSTWETRKLDGKTLIVVKAFAYRDPDDKRPGIGLASEPFPGATPFTKDSELMNAETSAWGRAIAALGFEVQRGIATAEEVKNRQSGPTNNRSGFASEKQENLFRAKLKDAGGSANTVEAIVAYAKATMTGERDGPISEAIDSLMDGRKAKKAAKDLAEAANKWAGQQNLEQEADTEGLPEVLK